MWVEPEFVNRIECLKIYYIQLTIKDMLALLEEKVQVLWRKLVLVIWAMVG